MQLRLLLIEDSEDDALLLVRELRKGGFDPDFARVETPQELEAALAGNSWDAVIADYNMPAFTGLDALRIIRAKGLDLPFILVSGVIGEEQAVAAMKAGAHDYIMKGNFPRLVPALERELHDAEVRREQRQAEEELAEYRERLEEKVRERTVELEQARAEAEAANRAKSEFLSNMTHEMRTPLTGVLGVIDFLLMGELSDEHRHLLEMAKTSADSLKRLINDILDFSRMSAGRMSFRMLPFAIRGCIHSAVDILAMEAEGKGLRFSLTIDDVVPGRMVGDEGRLRQLLMNLVGNAVKFTEEGEIAITVRAVSFRPERDALLITVRDSGIGIPADCLDKIFDKFTQVDMSMTKSIGGCGIGLALAKQIVEAMGGEIRVESRQGEGSTFTFTVPLDGGNPEAG